MKNLIVSLGLIVGWITAVNARADHRRDLNQTNETATFQRTLYPHLKARCSSCHSEKQSPFFASNDPLIAYEAAKKRIDFSSPLASKLWIRSQNGHCDDASLCGMADPDFLESLKTWIHEDPLFSTPEGSFDWKSPFRTLDLSAPEPATFDFPVQPGMSLQFQGIPYGNGLYLLYDFKMKNEGKSWEIAGMIFDTTPGLKVLHQNFNLWGGIVPANATRKNLKFNPAFFLEIQPNPSSPQFRIQIRSLIPLSEPGVPAGKESVFLDESEYTPKITAIQAGVSRTCAYFENQKIKCFGNNSNGELGHHWTEPLSGNLSQGDSFDEVEENLPELHLPALSREEFLTSGLSGQSHACFNLKDEVVCVGAHLFGQLGVEGLSATPTQNPAADLMTFPRAELFSDSLSDLPQQKPEIKQVSVGFGFTCVLLKSGYLKCFGTNYNGELGLGDKKPRGQAPGTMKEALPFVNSSLSLIRRISMGSNHTCAQISEREEVRCFGTNRYGELGSPGKMSYGDEPHELFDQAPPVRLSLIDGPIQQIVSGANHNCVLFQSGRAQCWGKNTFGQLGLGDSKDRVPLDPIQPETLKLPAQEKIRNISAGGQTTCALTEKNRVYCFGRNNFGQLGIGNSLNRGAAPHEVGEFSLAATLPATDQINELSVGSNHTCATLQSGALKCWGANSYGQLGLGDTLSVGKNPVDLLNLEPALLGQRKNP
jgi:alpha-tubulin suppressor-like RCC1 family protein